jgi:hypothetical protein
MGSAANGNELPGFVKKWPKMEKVKLFQCFTKVAEYHEDVWGNQCEDPRCLDLGTSQTPVVSFTSHPLSSRGMRTQYSMDSRLGAPQNLFRRYGQVAVLEL